MAAPIGAVVAITYDWSGAEPPPTVGDYLVSSGGSVYRIVQDRPSRARPGRRYYRCLKSDAVLDGARMAALRWYVRSRSQKREKRPLARERCR